MTNQFEWNPHESQEFYDEYESTTLYGSGKSFSKDIGCDFRMDASSKELTLKVTEGGNVLWPSENFIKPGTAIRIFNGKFSVDGAESVIIGGPENNDPRRLDLDIQGELSISAKASVQIRTDKENMAKMSVRGNGVLSVRCLEAYCYTRLELSNNARVVIDSLQVTCQKADIKNLLTNFTLKDNAVLSFKNTNSSYGDAMPFDFLSRDYPENIFTFIVPSDSEERKPTIFFDKLTGSTQFAAMLGRKIISINNVTDFDYLKRKLSYDFADGGMYITIK
ncbi:hypothetical protein ACOY5P_24060 [Enterobacter asburiae]|uniref:hypothetical protein n=1 Tax=Enterobacter asburiae TaxID=61645 RepID=UPI002FF72B92